MQPNVGSEGEPEASRLVAREHELQLLRRILASPEAELVALYGRRRVGKTFLVRHFFQDKGLFFVTTGLKDGGLAEQLDNFTRNYAQLFYPGASLQRPRTWRDALEMLTRQIESVPRRRKVILFFDELPWMASSRSGLLQALDAVWNQHWSMMPRVKVVLCGSAASWMLDHLIHAKGGLYNRLTQTILLRPFSLHETERYLRSRGVRLNQQQVLAIYMATGGIPHYLKRVVRGRSAAQNIDVMCFKKDGLLFNEFPHLFRSLFDHADLHERLVRQIAASRYGLERGALLKKARMKSGGTFNKRLRELEAAGFITSFVPFGRRRKHVFFRITDEYTSFYLRWIEPLVRRGGFSGRGGHWQSQARSPAYHAWAGYAFESICHKHLDAIRRALDLTDTACEIGSWRTPGGPDKRGAQIDLLFDRDDGTVTLVEIKHSDKPFAIDKDYARVLANKIQRFAEQTACRKQINLCLLTTAGLKQSIWSEELVDAEITLADLFRD